MNLTWNEFYQLAKENYTNGGDCIVECWEESDFNEYVNTFGPMTTTEAFEIFSEMNSAYSDYSLLEEF